MCFITRRLRKEIIVDANSKGCPRICAIMQYAK